MDRPPTRERSLPVACLLAAALGLAGCDGQPIDPTLSAVHAEVFGPSCSNEACHGGSDPQNGLDLQSVESSYSTLVGVEALEVEGVRVVPGDSDTSVMYQLLWGPGGEVRQMPVGYQLDERELRAIRDWIDLGAEAD